MISRPPLLPKVLVVDDDPISRTMLVLMLQSANIHAEAAFDGQHAVEIIERRGPHCFEVVITDVQMPRMDGLALLAWINTHASTTATVIMTANQERELVSASLRGGAVEFLDKPFDLPAILRAMAQATETHLRRTQQLAAARRLHDIADINQRLTRTALGALSPALAKLTLTTRFYALDEAGGDLVKASVLDPERILLVLGDVSGHGLKEGFLSAYFQGIIEGMAHHRASGRDIANAFNRFLNDQWNDPDPFAINTSLSACFLELDLGKRRVSILNCGSPGVILADEQGCVTTLAAGGAALGWFPGIEPAQATRPIAASGQLYLWSDGLADHAAHLGIPPLVLAYRILQSPQNSLGATLLKDAGDDIVVCRVDWTPPGPLDLPPPLRVPLHQANYPGDSASLIDSLHAEWTRVLQIGLPLLREDTRHDITLCLREAVLNALQHGCGNDPAKTTRLELVLDEAPTHLLARIADNGLVFDPTIKVKSADPDHISLGLCVIRSMTESIRHSPDGRTIEMTFQLPLIPAA